MIPTEDLEDYKLTFDRASKCYATRNQKFIIRPPLSKELKEEVLSDSDLAVIRFVLKTNNTAMYIVVFLFRGAM